ncbi:MAG: FHA domain-containing protein [Victivallaceae bacterium]|nr:FHA domain-containing protein [Victivallaceae bacterium]
MANNPKLTVLHEMMRGKSFELDKDVMSIGRRESMDICIPESSRSGHHADLIRSERDGRIVYTLRDNDSTNGTRINDKQITEQELKDSDLILFGMVEVLYEAKDLKPAASRTSPTIDISNLDSGVIRPTVNLNPLAGREAVRNANVRRAIIAVVALLGLCAVILAGLMLFNSFSA